MELSLINPYIRVAMPSVIPSGVNIAMRAIYDYELIYLESGEFTFIYGGAEYPCKSGDFIFIHPGVAHSFIIERGDISQPHIHFDITYRSASEDIPICYKTVEDMTDAERSWIHKDYFCEYPTTPFIHIRDVSEFLKKFYRVISKDTSPVMKKGLLTELIGIIALDNYPDTLEEQKYPSLAEQIKDYLDAGNGLSMSLDDFEKTYHYSKFYLEKQFKREFGTSLIEYRNQRRMIAAECLLEHHSVSRVAELLGYQSIYSFSRAYKEHNGASPSKRALKLK